MKNRGLIPKLAIGTLVVACSVLLALFFFPNLHSSLNREDINLAEDIQVKSDAPTATQAPVIQHVAKSAVSADGSVVINGEHQADVVLVVLESGADPTKLTADLAGRSCLDMSSTTVTSEDVANGFAQVPLAQGYNVADAVAALKGIEYVSSSQPNYFYHALEVADANEAELQAASEGTLEDTNSSSVSAGLEAQDDVNDPYGKQDASGTYNWHLSRTHTYEAWSHVKGESLGDGRVTVAILDSGYKTDHEDLTAWRSAATAF